MNRIEKLREYDKLYFESGTSPISDTDYDLLKNEAKNEFPNDPYFNEVGYKSTYKTIKLPFVMGGLEKVDLETVDKWINQKDDIIIVSDKLDGNSILVSWENGKLVFAASRGDENEGQNILEKARFFIPEIPVKEKVTLRGEVVLLGKIHEELGFKNRRNGVTGLLRRDEINPEHLKLLSVYFYEVVECPTHNLNEYERFSYISQILDLDIPQVYMIHNDEKQNAKKILTEYIVWTKENAEYDIDGLVLTFNESTRENVKYPKNKVKFKVNENSVKTKVLDIEWNVTRTGYLKPVILIEPVDINGVTVSRVSAFNYSYIKKFNIGKNSIIGIVRSGDVVPYITEIFEESSKEDMIIPEKCPECGSVLLEIGKELHCTNDDCYLKNVRKLTHFFTTMGCEEISMMTFKNLGVEFIQEVYLLNEEYIETIPGFGKKKAQKIISEIKKTLKVKPETLLEAFGIPMIGKTLSKELCDKFDFDELFEIKDPEVLGLGSITSETFINNINKCKDLYLFLKSFGLKFEEKMEIQSDSLNGMSFELTGKGPMERDAIKNLIESKGGKVKGISTNSSYLVTNDLDSKSGKMKKAEKLQIPVITYNELFEKFLSLET